MLYNRPSSGRRQGPSGTFSSAEHLQGRIFSVTYVGLQHLTSLPGTYQCSTKKLMSLFMFGEVNNFHTDHVLLTSPTTTSTTCLLSKVSTISCASNGNKIDCTMNMKNKVPIHFCILCLTGSPWSNASVE